MPGRGTRELECRSKEVVPVILRVWAMLLLVAPVSLAQDLSKSFVIDPTRPYVYLKFDHIGARKPLSPDEAHQGLWLRLVSNCRIPIVVGIFDPKTGDPGLGVFDEVIAINPRPSEWIDAPPPETEAPRPKPPRGYWSEVYSTTTIGPGEDLFFSVPLNHVSPYWYMEIKFRPALPGGNRVTQPETTLCFYWWDIPQKLRESK
jgi:hypothetical protein